MESCWVSLLICEKQGYRDKKILNKGDFAKNVAHHHITHYEKRATSPIDLSLENAMESSFTLNVETNELLLEMDVTITKNLYGLYFFSKFFLILFFFISYALWQNTGIDSKIYALDIDGNEIELPKRHRSFTGDIIITPKFEYVLQKKEIGHVSLTFYDDHRFTATIFVDSGIYNIDIIELYQQFCFCFCFVFFDI